MEAGTIIIEEKKIEVLDPSVPQETGYCIPLWLRDEQVAEAIKRVKGRIERPYGTISEPIAIVCFGPSLNDTWEKIKDFKHIMTCSGAHKFLVDRGIIPTHHVEVDPRAHKVELIGQPQKETEYLIASTCHQKVFDHLEGYNVKLWHVFVNEPESLRLLPRGEWALIGGAGVGLRVLIIARFLGFTNFHIFGMDGCEGKTGQHAAFHPNQYNVHAITNYDGIEYRTTAAVLECARQTFQELDNLPDVKATFYGEGLVQAMAKNYKPNPIPPAEVGFAFSRVEIMSSKHKELTERLHHDNLAYGIGGGRHAEIVEKIVEASKLRSVLDYGCGKGYLAKSLSFPIWEYDPAIPGKDESPRPADLVVCTDVLEHIERDRLLFVFDDLRRCLRKVGFFVIDTKPAQKFLADGRNTHLIQEGKEWWEKKLNELFVVSSIREEGSELFITVGPKLKKQTGGIA